MTYNQLEKGNDIINTIANIEKIKKVLSFPYPVITDSGYKDKVNFISIGEETAEGLKKVMNDYLNTQLAALKEEFKEL